jgi:dienelactone hydrolase
MKKIFAASVFAPLALVAGMDRTKLNVGAYYLKPYAQTEKHVKDAKECGIDFFVCMETTREHSEKTALDLFHKYGIGAFVSNVMPSWHGGPTRIHRSFEKEAPLRHWLERGNRYWYRNHPAVWGFTIGDEPGALAFPHYREVISRMQEQHPDKLPFLNLLPNVAPKEKPDMPLDAAVAKLHKEHPNLAARGPDAKPADYENLLVYYQARNYEEYIRKYCELVPLDYLSYDFYLYKGPDRRIAMSFENMKTVADACRRTGRDFWSVMQVNSSDKNRLISVDGLRYQAYQSMAYGATTLIWACYTYGWWHHQVLDEKGEKTPQYEKLKTVNAEIHRFADIYMDYRNVNTHLVGDYENPNVYFRAPEKILYHTEKTGTQKFAPVLDTPDFVCVRASGNEALMIGEMVGRKDPIDRALFIAAADDPMEKAPHEYEILFKPLPGRRIRAFGPNGELPISSGSDGYSYVPIRSNGAVLLTSEIRPKYSRGPWADVPLDVTPKSWPAEDVKPESGVRSVWIEGEDYKGKKTRFFAYYGLPQNATESKKCPAMVLVHGGEGTAFADWVRLWNSRGYAAIAMDTCGAIPLRDPVTNRRKRHEWSGPEGWGRFSSAKENPKDQWTYHAVASVIRSHNFLCSMPEVDRYRVGITGISWGGYLTCIAAGVDERYLFAVPVYGCGYFGYGSRWKEQLERLGDTGKRWLELWDASVYLPEAKCLFYWVSGKDDPFFPYGSLRKSASLIKGTSIFNVTDHMVHGQKAGSTPECIREFADRWTGMKR